MADFGALGKMFITPEGYKLAKSAVCRLKELDFLYRMITFEFKIQCETFFKYHSQNVQQNLI